jgi:formate hydrogenlyase subunit 3/multisubunit Na+/H+ antiporter MnhD subunit
MSLLLMLTLGLPLLMLLLLAVKPTQARIVSMLAAAPLPGFLLALASGRDLDWSLRMPGGWAFELDRPAAMLLLASSLIWCAAGACASRWLKGRPDAPRFAMWWLLTLWGSLGVFAAADLASFYLLYAAASLPAYGLIVWDGGTEERRAGKLALAAVLLGEALLLAAFVLMAAGAPGQSLLISDGVATLAASPFRDGVIALLILGFGLKIGLIPLHGWMPLSYASGPLLATAALSGATSKAGLIGLITFLPFGTGLEGWGMVLLVLGLASGFYGVIVGLFQSNPRSVLAYSSVSQLGQMAAMLGLGLATGSPEAALLVGFYALYHVLAKGGLFLAIDALSQAREQRMRLIILVTAGITALGFAGLPLAGGALAKLAVKPLMADGAAGLLFAAAACGSALLMLHFIRLIRSIAPAPDPEAAASPAQLAWAFIFALAMLLPWLLFDIVTGLEAGYALTPGVLLELGWPVAAGLLTGWGLAASSIVPSGPATSQLRSRGDVLMALWDGLEQLARAGVQRLFMLEAASRKWTISSSLLVLVMLVLTILLAIRA